jgi:hypothetical protein
MKYLISILNFIGIVLLFAGCTGSNLNIGNFEKEEIASPIISDSIVLMPKDAAEVILSISSQILNTGKISKNIYFERKNNIRMKNYELFNFKEAKLLQYNYDSKVKNIVAELTFSDTLGRTSSYTLIANYVISKNDIRIKSYVVNELFQDVKDLVCFVLPAEEFKSFTKDNIPKSFYKLYEFAAKRAIIPSEARRYNDKKEWLIMVFYMNKMSMSAITQIGLSTKNNKYEKGYMKNTKFIYYDGWRVGTLMVKSHLM